MTTNNPETKVKVGPEWWEWVIIIAALIALVIAGLSTALVGITFLQALFLVTLIGALCAWPWLRWNAWFPKRGPRQ